MVRARRLLGALATAGLVGVAGAGASGGCNAVLAIPDPTLARHVTCVDGTCTCEAGFTDCDSKRGDDCAIDLGNDPHHCGACGRDCQGGGCKGGLCQPLALATLPGARGLSMHGGSLLVGRCGSRGASDAFLEVPAGGGEAVTLVRSSHCAAAQALAGDALYWSDTSALMGLQLSAQQQTEPLFVAATSAWKVVASGTHVYWGLLDAVGNRVGVERLKLADGVKDKVYPSEVFGLAVGMGGVYWSAADGIHTLADNAPTSTLSIMLTSPRDLAIDATTLYVGAAPGIYALPVDGSTLSLLVPGANGAHLTTDATTLFWLDDLAGSVNRAPLAGGKPTVLATGVSFTSASVVVADATFVYWLAGDVVARIPR